jgi:CBS domain containing-hemolysin-like protein
VVIEIALSLVAFAVLIVATAVFVAAEFALVTVDRAFVEEKAEAGDRSARWVRSALRTLSFQLSGAQFGITVSALLTGFLAEPALAALIRPVLDGVPVLADAATPISVGAALLLATVLSMLFGELVPKNAALARPFAVAIIAAPLQMGFSRAFAIPIRALNGVANRIVRGLGVEPQEELASARSADELGLLAAISARAGALPSDTATLVQRTVRFPDTRAEEAMTPRVDVLALPLDAAVSDLMELARISGHSRFPVYDGTLDQVVGVVSVMDGLRVPPASRAKTAVQRIAAEPVLVPGSLLLDAVLDRLGEAGADLAVVVDEYGGTDGIVTTEDLVEELVGEIEDEYDIPHAWAAEVVSAPDARPTLLVQGLLREGELLDQTGFALPPGPYETLAGFIMAKLGRIPQVGEVLSYEGWEFQVVDVDRRRIEQVHVRLPEGRQHPAHYRSEPTGLVISGE